jgi:hypothetical protein
MEFVAYIDPGSGSLIIQAAIAAIVAVPFFFREQIRRLVRAVRRTDDKSETTGSPDSLS